MIDEINGSIKVTTNTEPTCCVTISLTSPAMREEGSEEGEGEQKEKPGLCFWSLYDFYSLNKFKFHLRYKKFS